MNIPIVYSEDFVKDTAVLKTCKLRTNADSPRHSHLQLEWLLPQMRGNTPLHSVLGSTTVVKTLVNKQAIKIWQVKGQNFKEVTSRLRVSVID